MVEISHHWRAYARLQQQVGQSSRADAQAWAVEAGLDHFLGVSAGATDDDVARAVSTARRREAHRGRALRRHAEAWSGSRHPEAAINAGLTLKAIQRRLTGSEWDVLCDVGAGRSYDEIAKVRGGTSGSYRIRVLRLRRTLIAREAT